MKKVIKKTVLSVLDRYKGSGYNIDSDVAREMVADEIADEVAIKLRWASSSEEDINEDV